MPPPRKVPAGCVRGGRTPFFNTWSTFPILKLPGEIRNKIYGHLIPEADVEVDRTRPCKESAREKQHRFSVYIKSRRSRLVSTIQVDSDNDYTLLDIVRTLLLVSQQINRELTPLIYAKWAFCFKSMTVMNMFMNFASKPGLQSISNLVLFHATHGEPQLTDHRIWKIKHDKKWAQTCARIATELPSLQTLHLTIHVSDWPTQLGPEAEWVGPLMVMKGKGLDYVHLDLRHYAFGKARTAAAARTIENLMMTAEGREKRDLGEALQAICEMEQKEAEKALLPPVRARKALIIKIPESMANNTIIATVLQPVVKSKGLEKFHRIDLATAHVAFC